MRAFASLLSMLLATPLSGCVVMRGPVAPQRARNAAPASGLMGEADEIIAALGSGQLDRMVDRMTPRLREHLPVTTLHAATEQLREAYGTPKGIMEEQLQKEGALTWYSALVVYSAPKRASNGRDVLTPVLVQFALTPDRRMERLLVREHWYIEDLRAPAERYVPVTRFHVPASGAWTLSAGGPTRELNAHHGSESQRFAYDLVLVRDGKFRRPGDDPNTNEAYYGYGQPLRAPASGTVLRVVDGIPDNLPPTRGKAGGNGLVIDHGFGEVSSMWHARPGSLRVSVGDRVEAGQTVAEVGNSGRSTGAHIHIHVTHGDGGIALPAPLVDVAVDGQGQDHALPIKGQRVEALAPLSAPEITAGPRIFLDV